MKLYEYLAAGLPVVATGLPSLEGIADVMLVEGPDAAVQAIEQALAARHGRSPSRPERRRAGPFVGGSTRRDRRRAWMTRDLVVSSLTPTLASGTGLRTYGVVAALARERPVGVVYIVHDGDAPAPEYSTLETVRTLPLTATRGPRRGWHYARARSRGVPADLARGISPELAGAAGSAPSDARVIADGPVAAGALLPLARRREVVYLAHNLESGFRQQGSALVRFERTVLRTFSESWMATRADQRGAVELAGEEIRTRYVPNVVDVATNRAGRAIRRRGSRVRRRLHVRSEPRGTAVSCRRRPADRVA